MNSASLAIAPPGRRGALLLLVALVAAGIFVFIALAPPGTAEASRKSDLRPQGGVWIKKKLSATGIVAKNVKAKIAKKGPKLTKLKISLNAAGAAACGSSKPLVLKKKHKIKWLQKGWWVGGKAVGSIGVTSVNTTYTQGGKTLKGKLTLSFYSKNVEQGWASIDNSTCQIAIGLKPKKKKKK